jgi:gliding motility-associated lipoprotein GldD
MQKNQWPIIKYIERKLSKINSEYIFTGHKSSYSIPLFLLLPLFCIVGSCNSPYISKKRGYYKIDLPERGYQKLKLIIFPTVLNTLYMPKLSKTVHFFDASPENPYWINIDFPAFRGRIFLSYKMVGGKALYKIKQPDGKYKDSLGTNIFDKMVADAFSLTNKNNVVSNSIKDSLIYTPNGISGVFFKVGGNAATAKQFFLTDTTKKLYPWSSLF